MNCEMCGKEGAAYRTIVEGAEMGTCGKCSAYGKVTGRIQNPQAAATARKAMPDREEKTITILPGYGKLIKKKRESMGLSQEDFAKKLAEKASTIQKIETQGMEPGVELAMKLEKALGIKLLEEVEETKATVSRQKSEGLTLGDFVRITKKL